MKKGLTMIIAALVVIGVFCLAGVASAVDKSAGSDLKLVGTGTVDIVLGVNTDDKYSGLALDQYIYTPSLGMRGASYLEFGSSWDLEMYNITEEDRTQNLVYIEEGTVENARRSVYMANYDIGSVMGFRSVGNSTQHIVAYADGMRSEITIGGTIEGKIRLSSKVIDVDTKDVQSYEVNQIIGNYGYDWNSYAIEVTHEGDDKNRDWLGCP